RNDIENAEPTIPIKALTYISIKKKSGLPTQTIREFDFNYDYYGNNISYYVYNQNDEGESRLRLLSISEKNGSISFPCYHFNYCTDDLPSRYSYEKDIWGYYNNNEANTFIPQVFFYPDFSNDLFRIYPVPNQTNEIILPGANRLPNGQFCKIGMLQSISLPNGGKIEYDFEPHDFIYKNESYSGGGVRLKTLTIKENENDQQPMEVFYKYGNSNVSSGRVISLPVFGNYDPMYGPGSMDLDDFINLSYIRYNMDISSSSGTPIMYERVVIDKGKMGKSEFNFDVPVALDYDTGEENYLTSIIWNRHVDDIGGQRSAYTDDFFTKTYDNEIIGSSYNVFPYPPNTNMEIKRGKLISQINYKFIDENNSQKVNKTEYVYDEFYENGIDEKIIFGYKVGFLTNKYADNSALTHPLFIYGKYKVYTNTREVLITKTETTYDKNDENLFVVTNTHFDYNELGQMNEIKTVNPEGTRINRKTFVGEYEIGNPTNPDEMTAAMINLQENNILGVPVESVDLIVDGQTEKVISASTTQFKECLMGNDIIIRPSLSKQLYLDQPITNFSPSNVFSGIFNNDSRYVIESIYDSYDDSGLLNESHHPNGNYSSTKRGYNGLLPIVEIYNARKSEFDYNGYEEENYIYWFSPGYGTQIIKELYSYTGKKSLEIEKVAPAPNGNDYSSASKIFDASDLHSDKYIFSAWVLIANPPPNVAIGIQVFVDGIAGTMAICSDELDEEWQYLKIEIDKSEIEPFYELEAVIQNNGPIGTICYFDDIRFYPADAVMTTYTWDPFVGKTSVSGPNEHPVSYEYDDIGRLVITRDHEGNILTQTEYNQKNQ
ncbi:MAG: hypothetical protein R2764_23040, partial [Bacteroidales bacterium]